MTLCLGFADPQRGLHGVAVEGGGSVVFDAADGALHTLAAPALTPREGDETRWRARTDGLDVTFTALGEPARFARGRVEWCCRVSGSLTRGAAQEALDTLGHVVELGAPESLALLESRRSVSIWLSPALAIAALAQRPHGARGHEDDELEAILLAGEPLSATAVAEPLLSTAYEAEHGNVTRAGLELYEPPAEEDDEGPSPLSMRIAGEMHAVAELPLPGGGLLRAAFFSWRYGGQLGGGRYDIARPGDA